MATIPKGVSVSVTGRCKLTRWSGRDGAERTGLSVTVDARRYARPPARRPQPLRPTFDPESDIDDRNPDDFDDDDPDAPRRRQRRPYDEEAE